MKNKHQQHQSDETRSDFRGHCGPGRQGSCDHARGFRGFFGFRDTPPWSDPQRGGGPGAFFGPRGFRGPGGESPRDSGGPGGAGFGPGGFGGPRGFGRMHGWGERGGRRRGQFDSAELRLLLLQLIAEQPRHGYDLIRELESRSGGAYAPSPGVVYPTLTMLQDMGFLAEAPAEGARKAYAITPEGTAHLEANKAQAETLAARIAELGTEQQRVESSSVQRALKNLHQALVLRFAANRGDARDPELSHRVAALLDEVTQKIERS